MILDVGYKPTAKTLHPVALAAKPTHLFARLQVRAALFAYGFRHLLGLSRVFVKRLAEPTYVVSWKNWRSVITIKVIIASQSVIR
jgi:hypothetical protein